MLERDALYSLLIATDPPSSISESTPSEHIKNNLHKCCNILYGHISGNLQVDLGFLSHLKVNFIIVSLDLDFSKSCEGQL